jgi:hypothetical protein
MSANDNHSQTPDDNRSQLRVKSSSRSNAWEGGDQDGLGRPGRHGEAARRPKPSSGHRGIEDFSAYDMAAVNDHGDFTEPLLGRYIYIAT